MAKHLSRTSQLCLVVWTLLFFVRLPISSLASSSMNSSSILRFEFLTGAGLEVISLCRTVAPCQDTSEHRPPSILYVGYRLSAHTAERSQEWYSPPGPGPGPALPPAGTAGTANCWPAGSGCWNTTPNCRCCCWNIYDICPIWVCSPAIMAIICWLVMLSLILVDWSLLIDVFSPPAKLALISCVICVSWGPRLKRDYAGRK